MRFAVLILLLQFVTPAFAEVNVAEDSAHEKTSYSNIHQEAGMCLNVFLKENAEEKSEAGDKAPMVSAELIDFSFLTTALTFNHSRFNRDISNQPLVHGPLFKLNCNFLI